MADKISAQLRQWLESSKVVFSDAYHGGIDHDRLRQSLDTLSRIRVEAGVQHKRRQVLISIDASKGAGPAARLTHVHIDFSVLRDVVDRVADTLEARGD